MAKKIIIVAINTKKLSMFNSGAINAAMGLDKMIEPARLRSFMSANISVQYYPAAPVRSIVNVGPSRTIKSFAPKTKLPSRVLLTQAYPTLARSMGLCVSIKEVPAKAPTIQQTERYAFLLHTFGPIPRIVQRQARTSLRNFSK